MGINQKQNSNSKEKNIQKLLIAYCLLFVEKNCHCLPLLAFEVFCALRQFIVWYSLHLRNWP
jgi:hypothetical protein